jgi:phosphomannomutase
MTKIKFGTDGWRAIIAKDFTVENVARVTEATSIWLKKNFENPSAGVVCRNNG